MDPKQHRHAAILLYFQDLSGVLNADPKVVCLDLSSFLGNTSRLLICQPRCMIQHLQLGSALICRLVCGWAMLGVGLHLRMQCFCWLWGNCWGCLVRRLLLKMCSSEPQLDATWCAVKVAEFRGLNVRKADASPAKSPPSRKAWYKSFSRAPWHHPPPPHRHHQLHHKLHHHHHPPHPHSHPLTRPKVHIILTAELPPPHGWQLVVHLQASHGKPGCLLPQRRRLQWSRQAAAPFFCVTCYSRGTFFGQIPSLRTAFPERVPRNQRNH